MKRLLSYLLLLPIYFYQKCISPMIGPSCRFIENPVRRVDLIKWTHDNTYSIAEVRQGEGILDDKEFAAKKAEIEKKKKANGKQT